MRNGLVILFIFMALICNAQKASIEPSMDALLVEAEVFSDEENYEKSNALYQRISTHFLKEKQFNAYANTQIQIALNHQYQDRYQKADSILSVLVDAADKLTDPLILAKAYHKRGVSRYYLDQYQNAIFDYQDAIDIRQDTLDINDMEIVKGHRNIGHVYRSLQNYAQAKIQYQKALDLHLSSETQDSSLLVANYSFLGEVLTEEEDFETAKSYLLLALEYAHSVYKDEPWEIAKLYIERLSPLHKRTGDISEMIVSLQKALSIYNGLAEKYDEDWWDIANSYNNLGIAYELKNEMDEAIRFYVKAIQINQRFGEERAIHLADNYNNIAVVYEKQQQFVQALNYLDQAALIYKKEDAILSISNVLQNKGDIYIQKREDQKALQFFEEAIHFLIPDVDLNDIHQNSNSHHTILGSRPNLAELVAKKATIAYQIFQTTSDIEYLKIAAETYESFDELIERIRLDFKADESKQFLSNKAKLVYDEAIQVAVKLYELENKQSHLDAAFQYAEHSKAITLLDAVKHNRANTSAGIPSSILSQQQQLQSSISRIEQQIEEASEYSNIKKWREQLILEQRQIQQLQDSLTANYPLYHRIKNNTNTLNISDCQAQLLQEDEAIIQYAVGAKMIYVFIITKEEVIVESIDIFPLGNAIKELRDGIYLPFNGVSWTETQQDSLKQLYIQQARFLHQQLIAPFQNQINVPSKLYIIPDGVLGYLPFETLLTKDVENEKEPFTNLSYFGKKHQISYSYSVQLLQEMMMQNRPSSTNKILAVAPVFENDDLSPLYYNQTEVEEISQLYPSKTLLGVQATKAAFVRQAKDYNIIHLSSHARTNDTLPDLSYVAFSQLPTTSKLSQLLYVHDLYSLSLPADMIVLSACETGIGKLEKGEGIMSLARGFSYAGAKSIITTLWRVDDQKTSQIILGFYKALGQNQSKDRALWSAKQQMIEEGLYAHPYYWAGFIAIGNMSPIALNEGGFPLFIGVLATLFLLIFCWIVRKRFFSKDY